MMQIPFRAIVVFPLEMIFIGGIFAGFVWGGLWLREQRLRAVFPLRP